MERCSGPRLPATHRTMSLYYNAMDLVELEIDSVLTLRMLAEQDSEELFARVEANRAYLREWLPWVDDNTEVRHTLDFIRSTVLEYQQGEALHLGLRREGRLRGVVGFNHMERGGEGELGYWLDESLQGSGIMTRACAALVDHGFQSLCLDRIIILCDPRNQRSRRIAERLGFTLEKPRLALQSPSRAVRYVKQAEKG